MKAGGAPNDVRLAARQHGNRGYQACSVGCVGGLGDLAMRLGPTPPKESQDRPLFAITQARNTSAISAACSAWVPGTVLGCLDRETEPSLPVLPWPLQASVTPLYSVTPVTSRVKSVRVVAGAMAAPRREAGNRNAGMPARKWQSAPPDGVCRFTGKTWFSARSETCAQLRRRVYSWPHLVQSGCASARPPGADTRRPSPPPPLARVVLYLWGVSP